MSEQQKHTPGPWAAFSDESGAGHTNIVAVVPRTKVIASFTGKHKSDPDICLISAAPDGYAFADAFLEWINLLRTLAPHCLQVPGLSALESKAAEFIAKVEGRT
jgi:hypothetical protein